jgi:hypothetical protein
MYFKMLNNVFAKSLLKDVAYNIMVQLIQLVSRKTTERRSNETKVWNACTIFTHLDGSIPHADPNIRLSMSWLSAAAIWISRPYMSTISS